MLGTAFIGFSIPRFVTLSPLPLVTALLLWAPQKSTAP